MALKLVDHLIGLLRTRGVLRGVCKDLPNCCEGKTVPESAGSSCKPLTHWCPDLLAPLRARLLGLDPLLERLPGLLLVLLQAVPTLKISAQTQVCSLQAPTATFWHHIVKRRVDVARRVHLRSATL